MPTPEPTHRGPPKTVVDLLGDLIHDLTGLVKGEGRLLRAELSEAGGRVAKGAEMMAAGGILLLLAAIVLIQALVIVLAQWIGAPWASLAVGVVLLVIGAFLVNAARKQLSPQALAPTKTFAQTSRDVRLTKDTLS